MSKRGDMLLDEIRYLCDEVGFAEAKLVRDEERLAVRHGERQALENLRDALSRRLRRLRASYSNHLRDRARRCGVNIR
jgi:hypothetical protein